MAQLVVEFTASEQKLLAAEKRVEATHEQTMASMAKATGKVTAADRELLKQLREQEKAMRDGARVTKQHEDASESAARELKELSALFKRGAIDAKTYERAVDRVNRELHETQAGGMDGLIGRGATLLAGWTDINMMVQKVTESIDAQLVRQEQSVAKAKEIAAAQAGAAQNMGDVSPVIQRELFADARNISKEFGIDEKVTLGALNEAYGAGGDVQKAREAVRAAAGITTLTPASLATTAASSLDFSNAVPSLSAQEAMSLGLSTSTVARVPSQKQLSENLAPALTTGVNTARAYGIVSPAELESFQERQAQDTAALFSGLTQQLTDTQGEKSRTATEDFVAKMNEFLSERTDVADPGSIFGRINLLTQNAALQTEFLDTKKFGSSAVQNWTKQLLTPGTPERTRFEENRTKIGIDPATYNQVQMTATGNTFEQRVGVATAKVDAAVSANQLGNEDVFRGAITEITDKAMKQTRGNGIRGGVDIWAEGLQSTSATFKPTDALAEYESIRLQKRKGWVQDFQGNTPDTRADINLLDQAIAQIRELNTEYNRIAQEQLRATQEQTAVIRQQQQQQPNNAPTPNAIRAQSQAGAKQ